MALDQSEGAAVGPVEGVNYFDHQFLRKDDFEVSRRHHVNRLRQHDYVAHTPGIVTGLTVTPVENRKRITVGHGRGIDFADHEVVLQAAVIPSARVQTDRSNEVFDDALVEERSGGYEINLGPALAGQTYYVKIRRDEEATDFRTDPGVAENARLRERPSIQIDLNPSLDADKGFLILAAVELDSDGNVGEITEEGVRSAPAGSVIGDEAVEERNIAPGAVTESKLADDAVTSRKIAEADNTSQQNTNSGRGVKTGHLADSAVTDPKIATDAVGARAIAAGAVGTGELQNAAVTTDKLADDAVTSPNLVEADNAGQDTATGRGVKTNHLANGAVTSSKIASGQVLEHHLATDSVSTRAIAPAAVTRTEIGDDAIASQQLAEADNVTGQDTNTGSGVKTGHLAAEAITFDKLDPAVRSGVAAGFCAFNGVTDTLLSHLNVASVDRQGDGRYLIKWTDPIGAAKPLARRRGGITLTDELRSILAGDVADPTAARTVLAGALRESIVLRRESGTLDAAPAAARPGDAPQAPAYVAPVEVTTSKVRLGWTEASAPGAGIAQYRLTRDGAALATVDATARFYDDNGVTQGRAYTYGVVGVDAQGQTSDPVTVQVSVPDGQAPSQPALGVPSVSAGGVSLAWSAATDNVAGQMAYEVLRDGLRLTRTNALAFVDDSPLSGRNYNYSVVAVDAAGNRTTSNVRTVSVADRQPPSAPSQVEGDALAGNVVGITWVASTDDTGVSRYDIYRDDDLIGNTPLPFYLDEEAQASRQYKYVVEAVDSAGRRTPAEAIDVTTPRLSGPIFEEILGRELTRGALPADDVALVRARAEATRSIGGLDLGDIGLTPRVDISSALPTPERPSVAVSGAAIRVSWSKGTDDVGVTGYLIWRDNKLIGHAPVSRILEPNDGPLESIEGELRPFELARLPGVDVTTFLDRNPVPQSTHRYAVQAIDLTGSRSGVSTESSAVQGPDATKPTPPRHLTVLARTTSTVTLGWAESTDAGGVANYQVRDAADALIATVQPGGGVLQFTQTNLQPGRARGYRVYGVDLSGNRSDASALVETTTLDTTPPSVPQGLHAAAGADAVQLTWSASIDDAAVKEYRVFRDGVPIKTTTTTGAADDHVGAAEDYSYTVAAVDQAGNVSSQSSPATVSVVDSEAPTIPKDVVATGVTPYEVRIEWEASSDDSGVANYEVFRDGESIGTVPGAATVMVDQEVTPGNTYGYRVRARDTQGNVSDPSDEAKVTLDEDENAAVGTLIAYAYVPGQQRQVHVVDATPESVELQVVNPQDGSDADAFVNLVAFSPTEEAVPIVTLERLIEDAPPEVLGGALDELDEGETKLVGGFVRPSRVSDVLVATSPDRVAYAAENMDPGSVHETLPKLDPGLRDRLLGDARPARLVDLIRRTPLDGVDELVAPLDETKLGDLVRESPADVIGKLISVGGGDRLEAIVGASPSRELADAVLRVDPGKADAAIGTLPAERVTDVVLSAPAASRGALIDVTPASKFTDAAVAASEEDRSELLGAVSAEKLGEAVEGAPARKRGTLVESVDDGRLAEAIVASDPDARDSLVDKIGAKALGDAIAAGGAVGVAGVLSDDQVAEAIVATPEESRELVISGVSDEKLAATVGAASTDAKRTIVESTSGAQLAGAIAVATPEARAAVLGAATDEKLASTVLAASPQQADSLVQAVEPARSASIVSAAPEAEQGAVATRLG